MCLGEGKGEGGNGLALQKSLTGIQGFQLPDDEVSEIEPEKTTCIAFGGAWGGEGKQEKKNKKNNEKRVKAARR